MNLNQEKIDRLVSQIAGEEAIQLVQTIIEGKENVSEFVIAEKLNLPINLIRNILYKLQERNLVTSTRKKDKRKGWYIYYWTFHAGEAEILMSILKKDRIENLEKRLQIESETEYFVCTRECMRMNFHNALEQGFKCPECKSSLKQVDNSNKIKAIQKEIDYLQDTPTIVGA